MKGLFECLRNKVYREDEDVLQQIAANAAMDDTEIEAFESDDEDEDDELFDFSGLDLDEIDDADIERATNEFNMDEGNRAACRIKTVDLKEDSEIYDEGFMKNVRDTRLAKRDKKDAIKAAKRERNDGIDAVAKSYDDRYRELERRKRRLDRDMDDLDYEFENDEDPHWEKYKKEKRAAKDAYKAKKREIWARKEDSEDWELNEYDEDNVELQPETKLNRKISQDDDMRDAVGAADGSGHDFKTEAFDLMMEEVMDQIDMLDEEAEEKKYTKDYAKKGAAIGAVGLSARNMVKNRDIIKDAYKAGRSQGKSKGRTIAELGAGAAIGMGVNAARGALIGAAAGKGRELGEKIKAKRAAKAREIAMEEGISLDEALDFVLECECDLLEGGYDMFDIYDEDGVELQPETKLNKRVSQDDDMREFVGAGDGSGHDMRAEDVYEMYDEGGRPASQKKPPQFRDQNARNAHKAQLIQNFKNKTKETAGERLERLNKGDEALRKAFGDKRLGEKMGQERLNRGHEFLQGEYAKKKREALKSNDLIGKMNEKHPARNAKAIDNPMGDNKISLNANKKPINWKKGAAIAGGVAAAGAAAYGGKKLYDHIKAKRAAKAKEVAVEEGVSLFEAYDFILECEQDLLCEGYDLIDIYFEDYELYDEDLYDEDNVELQPETRLNRRISQDDDMREFVGASKGAHDNLKTEAAILAYEEGITLEEAMAWLLEEDAVDEAIAKLSQKGVNNGVFPNRLDLQDEMYDEDLDECAPKRQHQAPVGDVTKVSVDGVDTDDELMLGVEAVIREIEESFNDFDM